MARSYGSATQVLAKKETVYGTAATGNYEKFNFFSSSLSAEQNANDDPLLGQGRESRAPFPDIINDDGDLVVPVEARDIGRWLQLLMGNATVTNSAAIGDITFTVNPSAGHTITLNGVTWTFVASGATGSQTNIGASLTATLTQLANDLNASANASITPATYANVGGTKLGITHDTASPAGNSYTLASGNANGVVSGATLSGGGYNHTFISAAAALPSFTAEIGHANVPAYFQHTGCMLNSIAFDLQRTGAPKATLGIMAQGEMRFNASQGGVATTRVYKPFTQLGGTIKRNNVALGNVTGVKFTYSNGMEKVPNIRPDYLIDAIDPSQVSITGSIDARFADTLLVDDAINQTAVELEFAYRMPGLDGNNFSLVWTLHEVFLSRPKIPISGPGGVQTTFNWRAVLDEALAKSATVVLKNDVTIYA